MPAAPRPRPLSVKPAVGRDTLVAAMFSATTLSSARPVIGSAVVVTFAPVICGSVRLMFVRLGMLVSGNANVSCAAPRFASSPPTSMSSNGQGSGICTRHDRTNLSLIVIRMPCMRAWPELIAILVSRNTSWPMLIGPTATCPTATWPTLARAARRLGTVAFMERLSSSPQGMRSGSNRAYARLATTVNRARRRETAAPEHPERRNTRRHAHGRTAAGPRAVHAPAISGSRTRVRSGPTRAAGRPAPASR